MGSYEAWSGQGPRDRRLIVLIKRNRFTPVSRLWQAWQLGSIRTATRRAVEAGYRAFRPVVRIPLSLKNRQARKQWASIFRFWELLQWHDVLFTDESRFTLDFADGRVRVRRLPHERYADHCMKQHDRYGGGSVMIWGGIWHGGRTAVVLIQGTLNAVSYRDNIVVPHIIPTVRERELTLQQDNARPHTASSRRPPMASSQSRYVSH